jgi:hypothetical protein
MSAAQQYCHRAVLLERGRLVFDGSPADAARRYVKLNDEAERPAPQRDVPGSGREAPLRISEVWVEEASGARTQVVANGEPLRLRGVVEARRDLASCVFSFELRSGDGVGMFSVLVEDPTGHGMRAGERLTVRADIDNPLAAGGYLARLWASEGAEDWDPLDSANEATTLEVIGGSGRAGVISPSYESGVERAPSTTGAMR